MTFDAGGLGLLVKDEDPAGGFTSLSRDHDGDSFVITKSSALGRTTTFETQALGDGTSRKIATAPDGTQSLVVTSADQASFSTAADGTQTVFRPFPDPRNSGIPSRLVQRDWYFESPIVCGTAVSLGLSDRSLEFAPRRSRQQPSLLGTAANIF
jgi:hypothetical protein